MSMGTGLSAHTGCVYLLFCFLRGSLRCGKAKACPRLRRTGRWGREAQNKKACKTTLESTPS